MKERFICITFTTQYRNPAFQHSYTSTRLPLLLPSLCITMFSLFYASKDSRLGLEHICCKSGNAGVFVNLPSSDHKFFQMDDQRWSFEKAMRSEFRTVWQQKEGWLHVCFFFFNKTLIMDQASNNRVETLVLTYHSWDNTTLVELQDLHDFSALRCISSDICSLNPPLMSI